jgi:predicted dehydrogenase
VELVYAEMDRLFYRDVEGMTIEDTSGVVMRFKSGAIGVVSSTTGAVSDQWWVRWSIVGSSMTLEAFESLAERESTLRIYHSARTPLRVEILEERGRDPYLLAERDFIEAILRDRETRTPIREGLKTLKLTLAAVEAAEKRTPIRVE